MVYRYMYLLNGSFMVTVFDAWLGKLKPASFCAKTRNTYWRPSMRFEMFICVVTQIAAFTLCHVSESISRLSIKYP